MKTMTAMMIGMTMAVAIPAHAQEPVTVTATTVAMAAGSARLAGRALPSYPMAALRDGERFGRVALGYDVDASGAVSNVRVLSAYPVQVFTRASTRAVESWRMPAGEAGSRTVEFTFSAD